MIKRVSSEALFCAFSCTCHFFVVILHRKIVESRTNTMFFQNSVIKKYLAAQIAVTNKQIDTLVYALYGLTEEEIKIVEQ